MERVGVNSSLSKTLSYIFQSGRGGFSEDGKFSTSMDTYPIKSDPLDASYRGIFPQEGKDDLCLMRNHNLIIYEHVRNLQIHS
ncbi:unnamed protein product [Dovyalis caffra]|uniref:Uncharacterized protein n=1 Tax=Dovyalis caffra TaxID=77055 RepID=A0AAV1QVL6_9ROSI|nr:unnamed protein product [Dovyalis caffra]